MQKAFRKKEGKQNQRNKIVSVWRLPCFCSQNKTSWKRSLELHALFKEEPTKIKIGCIGFSRELSEISKNENLTLLWTLFSMLDHPLSDLFFLITNWIYLLLPLAHLFCPSKGLALSSLLLPFDKKN